jgi:hypothetical protein
VRERALRELESLGVDQVGIYLLHDVLDSTLEASGAEVIPALGR